MKSLSSFTVTLAMMFVSGMIGCAARSHFDSQARLYNLSTGELSSPILTLIPRAKEPSISPFHPVRSSKGNTSRFLTGK